MKVYIAGRIRDVILFEIKYRNLCCSGEKKMDDSCWTVSSADYSIDIFTSKII